VKHFGYGTYLDEFDQAAIPRERALKAGHHLLPMASFWSPDSHFVIVPRGDERFVGDYPYIENVPADGSFRPQLHVLKMWLEGEKPPTLEWLIFNIPAGTHCRINFPYEKLLEVDPDGLPIRKKWWSADHRHLYALTVGRHMGSALLFDVNLLSGNARTMVEEHMTPRMEMSPNPWDAPDVWVSPDGKDVLWFSERDGWGHLYLYDGQTGKLRNQVTRGEWLVRDIIHVDEQRRRIYFTAAGREKGNPYYRYLYRINFDGSDLTLLSSEAANHLLTSREDRLLPLDGFPGYQVISPSGKFVVYNFSTPDQPPQAVIRSTENGELISTFEKADATELFATHYRPPEEFVAKAADGSTDLWSLVYKPSNFDPSKRYPVIDLEYAAPVTAVVPREFSRAIRGVPMPVTPAMLAELGFVVVTIDARGTPYRSRQFSQAGFGQLNIIGLDDHVAVIKQLAERFNYVDISRVGIVGGSFGGWSALWGMLDFPDFFKVGVAGSPVASFQSESSGEEPDAYQGLPVYSNGTHLRPKPDEVPENWKVIDMRQKAANLKGHLLVIIGELDENAFPASAFIFLHALMQADKDFDLIYLIGAAHNPITGGFAVYNRRRIEDYLVRYLITEPSQK
jgi:dipeptidyl aminopeptidase/acylaminoacyl peptidase